MKLATNAPAHWPTIAVAAWDTIKTWNNAEPVAIALDRDFVAAGTPCPILLYGSRLHDEGVLEVPIQVTDKGQKYCVFLYPSGAADSAEAFATTRQFIESDGSSRAVYYAPEPLGDAAPRNPYGPFRTRYIALFEDAVPAGEYAMWWATPGDSDFATSRTFQLLDAFYRACDSIETFVLADVLQALGKGRGPRTALPDDSNRIAMYGPGEQLLIFGASSKGLRIFFPVHSTDPHYRERLWKHVVEYARRFKSNLELAGGALDPNPDRRGFVVVVVDSRLVATFAADAADGTIRSTAYPVHDVVTPSRWTIPALRRREDGLERFPRDTFTHGFKDREG